MKFAWFTPYSDKSAIGKFSQTIAHELNSQAEVDLWVPKGADLLSADLRLIPFTSEEDLSGRLAPYDFLIYNLGDHLGFHKDIYDISKRHQGIVILHDFMMHHFFYAYHLVQNKDPDAYVNDMTFYYGDEGRNTAVSMVQGKTPPEWDLEIMRYPFWEKAVEGALGVVCHSYFLADRIGEKILPPVGMIRMPFYQEPAAAAELDREAWGIPRDTLLLVTLGHVNFNKRIDRVIEYIGKHHELRDRVYYACIGSYDHNPQFAQYAALINQYALQDRVKFFGYQPDPVLHSFMASADVFVNLRYPVMEGGSASLVEQMSYGKPVIVTDAGHYSELPDDCVVKISREQDEDSFAGALRMLAAHESVRRDIGSRGRNFVAQECTVRQYCSELLEYLPEVTRRRPACDLADRVAREFSVMKVARSLGAVDDVANEISRMFSSESV